VKKKVKKCGVELKGKYLARLHERKEKIFVEKELNAI